MDKYIEWDALANILVVGTLVGAGLPALFAIGVRVLAGPDSRGADGHVTTGRKVIAWACFGVVILAVFAAIAFLVSGGH
ncbi:hypothetical protein [Demequina sp.]|uniref:hypothetical protein n=1 Tax=Demequina sp. TaxID=2050685 RepID=UPI003A8B7358